MRTLVERVEVEPGYRLEDYAEYNYWRHRSRIGGRRTKGGTGTGRPHDTDRQLDTAGRRRRRDGVTGRLVDDPKNPEAIANTLDAMFVDAKEREVWDPTAVTA